jgi:hypothetical protein
MNYQKKIYKYLKYNIILTFELKNKVIVIFINKIIILFIIMIVVYKIIISIDYNL